MKLCEPLDSPVQDLMEEVLPAKFDEALAVLLQTANQRRLGIF